MPTIAFLLISLDNHRFLQSVLASHVSKISDRLLVQQELYTEIYIKELYTESTVHSKIKLSHHIFKQLLQEEENKEEFGFL